MKTFTIAIIALFLSVNIFGQCLNTEQEFKDYFKKNISTLDPIEGLWTSSCVDRVYDQYNNLRYSKNTPQGTTVAVIKSKDYFICCYFDNEDGDEIKFYKTANHNIYLYNHYYVESYATAKANVVLNSSSLLEYSYDIPESELRSHKGYINGMSISRDLKWIKLFPAESDFKSNAPASGTGFAISSDGYIVTNHHVINEATNIKVRGVNGDFSKTYKAKVVTDDKNNDLAIIKIDEVGFSSLGTIPYIIPTKSCDVGCSIFCLGYPLRASMGEEVKLTNGIISSKSGFQGDVTTYQITAPVQPGNSGGPLFDDKGNLIGVINAKHLGAENVSYAIKASYLLNLIDIMPTAPKLQTVSSLNVKTLPQQVEAIKNFTYIIEIN